MKYSENFDEEFSQPDEKKSGIYDNDKVTNYEENQNNSFDNSEQNTDVKKKNIFLLKKLIILLRLKR